MAGAYCERRRLLACALKKRGVGAAAIVPGPNFFYLTGINFIPYARMTMIFLTDAGELVALLPALERLKWTESYSGVRAFYWEDRDGYETALKGALEALGGAGLGIEKGRLRAFEADALRALLGGGALVDIDPLLERQRMIKDAGEIRLMEEAARAADLALANTLDGIRAGMTELDVKRLLSIRLLEAGSDGFGYEPLALCAGNAANPHGTPGGRIIQPGDPILIACSAKIGGYLSDVARTVFCEFAADEHAQIHETVAQAGAAGRAALKAGVSAHDLNASVIGRLQASKFAGLIVHRAGHGCGTAIYEPPYIQDNNHEPIPEGAALILEPGLYREGDIGVRMEDLMVVGANGARALTESPRGLVIVGNRTSRTVPSAPAV